MHVCVISFLVFWYIFVAEHLKTGRRRKKELVVLKAVVTVHTYLTFMQN